MKVTNAKADSITDRRSAGILIHITSLPGEYGCGDMGPNAFRFVDFLHESGQQIWQLLPLSPTSASMGYSPYSSSGSFAGNLLLISPDEMVNDGLVPSREVTRHKFPSGDRCDFDRAWSIRKSLLQGAYLMYRSNATPEWVNTFEAFKQREGYWLNDFALFEVIQSLQGKKEWINWPEAYRRREKRDLENFAKEHGEDLERIKWFQFIFERQWMKLKAYCNERDVVVLGDIPFYVSHHSADVWANQRNFLLDKSGKMQEVAGVPPDYFNEDGQRWGMPVFDWKTLKENNFEWWIQRLKRNAHLFDFVRLDHFRAFVDYWSIPESEKTARNGKWKPGPGSVFFEAVRSALGNMPFVAEDLGDIHADVTALRDLYQMPGMKVLQFAFDENMPTSDHILHHHVPNSVVYTGTHDNNTIQGWYKELSKQDKKRIRSYVGHSFRDDDVHALFIRLAYSSVASTAIIPMQDLLGLDEESRMNTPASTQGNWLWRMSANAVNEKLVKNIKTLGVLYGRIKEERAEENGKDVKGIKEVAADARIPETHP